MAYSFFDPKSGAVVPLATVQANPSAYSYFDPVSGAVMSASSVISAPGTKGFFEAATGAILAASLVFGATLLPKIINTRLALPNGTITGQLYHAGAVTLISPPGDTKDVRLGFAGIYGRSNFGETALGNDLLYDDVWIEIAGTVYPVTVNGSTTFTVPSGGTIWTDALAGVTLPKNTIYRIGCALHVASTAHIVPIGGILALPKTSIQTTDSKGDYTTQAGAATSQAAAMRASTGNVTNIASVGFGFPGAPLGIAGTPLTSADDARIRCAIIAGMSIDWGANESNVPYAAGHDPLQGSYGGLMRGMGMTTNGRVCFMNLAIPGTQMPDMLDNPASAAGGASNMNGWAIRSALMAAIPSLFTTSTTIFGGPINDVTNGTLTTQNRNDRVLAVAAAFKARGARKIAMTTMRPNQLSQEGAGAANGYFWSQSGSHQGGGAGGGVAWNTIDAYIRTKPTNIDLVIDVYPAAGDATTIGNWQASGQIITIATSTTTPTANTAGQKAIAIATGGSTINLGDELAVNPQLATGASEKFIVQQIANQADGTILLTQRSNLSFSYTAGMAVAGVMSDDGVHYGHQGAVAEAQIIDANKSLLFA